MSGDVTYNFAGKAALVIGGTSGIGRATAKAFARAGAKVAVCDLADAPGFEQELREAGAPDALFLPLDVRSAPDVKRVVETVWERFGGFQIAVNNAGTEGRFGLLQTLEPEDFDHLVSVNLRGVWCGMRYQVPLMQAKGGVIINTASTAGVRSIAGEAVYSATKHGILGMTQGAALELADKGIRVNAVAPGPVATGLLSRMIKGVLSLDDIAGLVPMKRICEPEEIADAILWLASDAAGYVTGETLMVDGGLTQK